MLHQISCCSYFIKVLKLSPSARSWPVLRPVPPIEHPLFGAISSTQQNIHGKHECQNTRDFSMKSLARLQIYSFLLKTSPKPMLHMQQVKRPPAATELATCGLLDPWINASNTNVSQKSAHLFQCSPQPPEKEFPKLHLVSANS